MSAGHVKAPGELVENEVIPDLQDGGEGPLAGDPCPQVIVVVVETLQDIEHQDLVSHRVPEIA
jgi:hypothetical protein